MWMVIVMITFNNGAPTTYLVDDTNTYRTEVSCSRSARNIKAQSLPHVMSHVHRFTTFCAQTVSSK